MRFKKGSTVEVLSKKEVPSGSWRCGKIVSGNGHYYSVMYNSLDGNREETIMERVSRKSIRPCPPLVQGIKNWVPGDVVEVLDSNSWKIATISKVIDENYFLVRLLGSSHQFRVHSYNLRVRQSWQDDKWFVVGKGSGNCEDGRFSKPSTSKCHHKLSTEVLQKDSGTEPFVGDDCLPVGNNIGFQESHMVSSRTLKRGSSYCSPHIEAFTGSAGKVRIIEKQGRHQQMVPGRSSPLLKKVEAAASPHEMLGENYMHSSFNYKPSGYSEMDLGRGKSVDYVKYLTVRSIEPDDTESSAGSVGSCSSSNSGPYRLPCHYLTGPSQDTDNHLDDAESFCDREYEERCLLPSKEECAAEIHRLELNAYRCTLEALYASGPLSWEQEELVTNLRLMLHISNDEHLWQLRDLVSTDSNFPIS